MDCQFREIADLSCSEENSPLESLFEVYRLSDSEVRNFYRTSSEDVIDCTEAIIYPRRLTRSRNLLYIDTTNPKVRAKALRALKFRKIVRGSHRKTAQPHIFFVERGKTGHYEIEISENESCLAHVLLYERQLSGRPVYLNEDRTGFVSEEDYVEIPPLPQVPTLPRENPQTTPSRAHEATPEPSPSPVVFQRLVGWARTRKTSKVAEKLKLLKNNIIAVIRLRHSLPIVHPLRVSVIY